MEPETNFAVISGGVGAASLSILLLIEWAAYGATASNPITLLLGLTLLFIEFSAFPWAISGMVTYFTKVSNWLFKSLKRTYIVQVTLLILCAQTINLLSLRDGYPIMGLRASVLQAALILGINALIYATMGKQRLTNLFINPVTATEINH